MLCPNCEHELKEVSAKSHYGAIIKLNQCSCCGGIWFNDWELFSLKEAEAKKLDSVDAEKLKTACGVSRLFYINISLLLSLNYFYYFFWR